MNWLPIPAGDRGSMRSRSLTIFALWTLYGLFNTVVVHYRSLVYDKPVGWAECALYELSFAWIWAAVSPGVLWLSRRFPLAQDRLLRHGLIHLAAALGFAIVTKAAWDFSALPFVAPSQVPVDWTSFQKSILRAIDFGVLHYVIVLVVDHAADYYARYEDGRLRAAQLETRLANAQLQALRMQLHPHFLFNTLHSITELIHADPLRAEQMIVGLSDFLRLTLEHVGLSEVAVSQEVDFVRRYLEIEQMRFEDRLSVQWEVDPSVLDVRVPNLILQPLVENALKHGIAQMTGPGRIRIVCGRDNGRLRLLVADNGPGPRTSTDGRVAEGVGLSNTRSRLERLYGEEHSLHVGRGAAGGFEVAIRIPAREPVVPPAELESPCQPSAL